MINPFSKFRRDGREKTPQNGSQSIKALRDDAEENMTFDFTRDDLVNVIQFLSLALRTGSLKLHSQATDENGVIGFNHGTVSFIQFADSEGTEAMAQMMRTANMTGEFVTHEELGKSNVQMQNEELLAEAATRAERMKPRGGRNVAARTIVNSADELRASRSEKLRTDGPDPEERKRDASRKSEAAAHPGAKASPPAGGDKKAAVKTAAPKAKTTAEVVKPEKAGAASSSTVRTVLGVLVTLIIGIAIVLGGIYWVLRKMDDIKDRDQRQVQEQQERERVGAAETLVQEARKLFDRGDFSTALENVEQALELSPGLAPALTLRNQIEDATYREATLPIRAEVKQAFERFQQIRSLAPFTKEVDSVLALVEKAEALFQQAIYQESLALYQKAMLQQMAVLRQADNYREAMRYRDLAKAARAQALEVLAPRLAPEVWTRGDAEFTAGSQAHDEQRYQDAVGAWQKAEEAFVQAAGAAAGVSDVMAAAAEFDEVMQAFGRDRLERFAPEPWAGIAERIKVARALGAEGGEEALAVWKDAREALDDAMKIAALREVEVNFESTLDDARLLIRNKQWTAALKALESALQYPGYQENETARNLLMDVQYEAKLEQARASLHEADWPSVLKLAGAALSLNPRSDEARSLVSRAGDELIPRLTVVLHLQGRPVQGGTVRVKGLDRDFEAPVTFKLKEEQTYRIQASLPADGNTYYAPADVEYTVNKPGRQRLDLDISRMGPPKSGEPWRVPGLANMLFEPAPAGTFKMGSRSGKTDEQPVRQVSILRDFWMSRYEVTNEQYREFVKQTGYDGHADSIGTYLKHFRDGSMPIGDRYPVVYVSWENARRFADWLSRRERIGGRLPEGYEYRLPTEAEWEYCCGAGKNVDFYGEPRDVAWFSQATGPREVGTKAPNEWNLFDMHGNVWEWCHDHYAAYPDEPQTDPRGPAKGTFRVMRGGSWSNVPALCRSTYRGKASAKETSAKIGFRLVLAPINP